MTWHYQILRHREKNGSSWCAVHEVYRDMGITDMHDFEAGQSYTVNPVPAIGDDQDGVLRTLEMMLADAKKWPVLEVEA